MKKTKISNILKWKMFILPLVFLLFLIWFGLTLWRITGSDISFSILTFSHGKNELISPKFTELTGNDKAIGNFIAKENNLGIVSIRFNTFNEKSRDAIIFRIKKEGDNKWYYEREYNINHFKHKKLYPFGFPQISDSKGKKYIFEIVSSNAKKGNSIALSDQYPTFTSHYQFKKESILSSPSSVLEFMWKKTMRSFEQKDVLFSSLIYLTPLLFCMLFLFKKINFFRKFSLHYMLILVIIDTFLVKQTLSSIHVILTALFLCLLLYKKVSNEKIFLWSIYFLVCSIMLSILKLDLLAEKMSIWSYILLLIGTIMYLRSLRNDE